jgi:mannosyl-oligosaccharide alpha-1,2-mannosidase
MLASITFRRRRWLRANIVAIAVFIGLAYYFLFYPSNTHVFSPGSDVVSVQPVIGPVLDEGEQPELPTLSDFDNMDHTKPSNPDQSVNDMMVGPVIDKVQRPELEKLSDFRNMDHTTPSNSDQSGNDMMVNAPRPFNHRVSSPNNQDDQPPEREREQPNRLHEQMDYLSYEIITSGGGYSKLRGSIDSKNLLEPIKEGLPRKQKYPVDKLIKLPAKSTVSIPSIQASNFGGQSAEAVKLRRWRRDQVKNTFLTSWNQYKQYAWGKDEVNPVSNGSSDPFLGWAATLVDSMDSLQIMGLDGEYQEALQYVSTIDFTRTFRRDIPLFETVIRYLGGLIAAYDLSKGQDIILLQKAQQLADNLMGAFDTPNRMPLTYFKWLDRDTVYKYRSGTDTIFAEIASLSLEFTRLAQLTGNHTYYDAVARITDQIYEFAPNSAIPWLFPQTVDTSGCNIQRAPKVKTAKQKPETTVVSSRSLQDRAVIIPPGEFEQPSSGQPVIAQPHQVLIEGGHRGKYERANCTTMNMKAGAHSHPVKFTLGGLTDSAYEYFMKEYLLLNGGETKYIELYVNMVKAAKEHLAFQPQVENNDGILFMGTKKLTADGISIDDNEMSHLTCFVGGMFALGGRILNRPEDITLGSKITEGCVWAYNATRSGVMPESFQVRRCPATGPCKFDFDQLHGMTSVMPNVDVIPDEQGDGTRWPVHGYYDQPRSFVRMDGKYLLRPEAIESVFYMYRVTGDPEWQDKGWKMFESIVNLTKVVGTDGQIRGYSAVNDVSNDRLTGRPLNLRDSAESFWMGETLKYAYLLFTEPDVISLDDYVFNTEAHPFRRT